MKERNSSCVEKIQPVRWQNQERRRRLRSTAAAVLAVFLWSSLVNAQTPSAQVQTESRPSPSMSLAAPAETESTSAPDSASQMAAPTEVSLTPEEIALNTEQLQALFLKVYRTKDWPKAQAISKELLRRQPKSSEALYNSGLVFAEIGQLGWGIARFRQALSLWPSFSEAYRGLIFLERKLKLNENEGSRVFWFHLQDAGFRYLSLMHLIFFSLFLFGAAGFLVIKHLGRRRIAKITQESPPPLPVMSFLFCGVLVLALMSSLIKWKLDRLDFGTVVSPKALALSAPTAGALSLFEITEGQEVLIENTDQDFYQVLSMDGLSGWIKRGEVIDSSLQN